MESTSDGSVRIKDQGSLLYLTRKGYDMSSLVQSHNDDEVGDDELVTEQHNMETSLSEKISMDEANRLTKNERTLVDTVGAALEEDIKGKI